MGRGGQARDIYTWTQKVGRPVTDGFLPVNKVTLTFFLSQDRGDCTVCLFYIILSNLRGVGLVQTLFKVRSTECVCVFMMHIYPVHTYVHIVHTYMYIGLWERPSLRNLVFFVRLSSTAPIIPFRSFHSGHLNKEKYDCERMCVCLCPGF